MNDIDWSTKVSARNQFVGTITEVLEGQVNCEVTVQLDEDYSVLAVVTLASVGRMALEVGTRVAVLLQAQDVILNSEELLLLSARNVLPGEITHLHQSPVNTEVTVTVSPSIQINSVVSHEAAKDMDLKFGQRISAVFKGSSLIIALLP